MKANKLDAPVEIVSLNIDDLDVEQLEERLELAIAWVSLERMVCNDFYCTDYGSCSSFVCNCYYEDECPGL